MMSAAKNTPEVTPAELPVAIPASKGITPKDLAKEIGIDQKSLRRIMRSMATETPGQGGRWEIDAEFADALRNRVSRSHNRKVVKFVPKAETSK